MCGLVGASGTIDPNVVRALCCLSAERGKDSSGVGWYNEERSQLDFRKITGDPVVQFNVALSEFIDLAAASGNLIAHTRQATTGAVNNDNAHPFLIDQILFAHNGIISNYEKFGVYQVDSQALIHGIKKKDFSEYRGSIALIWMEEKGKINVFRQGNPLFRGLLKGALYMASEEDFLKEVGCVGIKEFKEGQVFVIGGSAIIKSFSVPSSTVSYVTPSNWDNHWENRRVDKGVKEQPRPHKKAVCKCGHVGKEHSSVTFNTGEWSCFAKTGGTQALCQCSAFVDPTKKKEASKQHVLGFTPKPRCRCTHLNANHMTRAGFNSCIINACECLMYVPESTIPLKNLIEKSATFNSTESDFCECWHELEYHAPGESKKCSVSLCYCDYFIPRDLREYGD